VPICIYLALWDDLLRRSYEVDENICIPYRQLLSIFLVKDDVRNSFSSAPRLSKRFAFEPF
jgi:hypothetical protein